MAVPVGALSVRLAAELAGIRFLRQVCPDVVDSVTNLVKSFRANSAAEALAMPASIGFVFKSFRQEAHYVIHVVLWLQIGFFFLFLVQT